MLENKNPYNQVEFEKQFVQSNLYQILTRDFDIINFQKLWHPESLMEFTPRQMFGSRIFSAVPFYYLQWLQQLNPDTIYDLGCGWNIFKKYIPNVLGIGPNSSFADVSGFVDENYVKNHQNYFNSVFSINSLHFIPLGQIQNCVQNFYSMIAPHGRGWLSLNLARMLEKETSEIKNFEIHALEKYVRTQLDVLDIDFAVVDIDFGIVDEYMDGNIRLVMNK